MVRPGMYDYRYVHVFLLPYDTSSRRAALAAYTNLSIDHDRNDGVQDPSDKAAILPGGTDRGRRSIDYNAASAGRHGTLKE